MTPSRKCASFSHHHGLNSRKKRLPDDAGLKLMERVVPLSVTVSGGVVQWVVFRLVFCCNANPVAETGHEMIMNSPDHVMCSEGAAESP